MKQEIVSTITAFFDTGVTKVYPKGAIITLAHQDPEAVSLLESGIVEQYDITPEGNKVTVNMFKPYAFFPMSWAINGTPNEYFYTALTEVRVRQVSRAKAVEFLEANPAVTFDLLSRVYRGTDALLRRLVLAASGVASGRLIFELLIEAYRFGTEVEGGKMCIKVRQSSLAERSGLARETVSRELHKLEADQLIERTKQGIVFHTSQLEERLDIEV